MLDNVPWSDRPDEVDSDQIETLNENIQNIQCYITWQIADILKISKSMKLLVQMENVSFTSWKKLNGFFLVNPIFAK